MNKLIKVLIVASGIVISFSSFANASSSTELKTYNAKTLQAYDGKNGHRAYVALNGYVYDVTEVPQWQGGHHYKGMVAGTDLTSNIGLSPHGAGIINDVGLKPVGVYKK